VSKLGRAKEFLEGVLPAAAAEVARAAAEAGHSQATLRRAAAALGVVKELQGEPATSVQHWLWRLPERGQLVDASHGQGGGRAAVSVRNGEHVGPEPLEVLSALRLEDESTWGEKATALQWRDAEQVLARDPQVRRFWLGRPRGWSKTTDVGAFTIAAALSGLIPPGERGLCAAGDKDQAGLLAQAVGGFVRRTDELHGVVEVQRNTIEFPTVGVTVEIMSSDASTAWGRKVSWAVLDELPNWGDTPSNHEFWDALSSTWPKVPGCRAVIIGSAGSPSHFSKKHHDTAAASGRWYLSEAHEPPPWMDPGDVADAQQSLSEASYDRLFRNLWVAAEDHLTTEERLRRCVTLTDWPAKPRPGVRYVIGVDLATRYDSTAICVAHTERRDRERVVVVDDMEVHSPRGGTDVSLQHVERRVEQLAKRYRPAEVHFDPSNASLMMENLRGRGLRVEEFRFSAPVNDKATNTLHLLFRDGNVALPDHPPLLDEILSVRVVETRLGGLKIDTVGAGRHDDQVDALSVCAVVLMDRRASAGKVGSGQRDVGYVPRAGYDRTKTGNPLADNTGRWADAELMRRQERREW
jgi:Terminase large subunit, ATPase domain